MAISFTNIWKDKVIDIIVKFIRTEFKNQISVYVAEEYEQHGNCSIRIFGTRQNTIRFDKGAFTNEYSLDIVYYLLGANFTEKAVEKMYRDVSRLEQLLWNKTEPNQRSDDGGFYGGRVESIDINSKVGIEGTMDQLLTSRIEYVCSYSKV